MLIFLCSFGKYLPPLDGRYRLFCWDILMMWSLILMTFQKKIWLKDLRNISSYYSVNETYPETSDCIVVISVVMIMAVEEF